jgi:hypothetical protein
VSGRCRVRLVLGCRETHIILDGAHARAQSAPCLGCAVGLDYAEERELEYSMPTVRGFFDSLSQQKIIRFIEHRVADRRVLLLIRKWLRLGVSEDGEWANATGRAGNWTGRRRKIRKAAPSSQPPGEEQNDYDDENDSADADCPYRAHAHNNHHHLQAAETRLESVTKET